MENKAFYKDVIISTLGQCVVLVGTFLINKIISSSLGPGLYTEFSLLNKVSSVFSFVMAFGLGIAVPCFIAAGSADDNNLAKEKYIFLFAVKLCFIASIVVSAIFLILYKPLSNILFAEVSFIKMVAVLLFAFSTALSTITGAYYRGLNRYNLFSILQIITSLVGIIFIFIAKYSIPYYFISRGMVLALFNIVLCFIIISSHKFKSSKLQLGQNERKSITRQIFNYCAPRVPGEFFLFSFTAIPLVLINNRFGAVNSAGIASGLTILSTVTPFFSMIGMVLLPYVSKNLKIGNMADVDKKISILLLIYIGLGVIASIVLESLTSLAIIILFSKEYLVYITPIRIICLSVLPQAIYLLLRNPIDAASSFPFNTVNLGVSFIAMIVMISLSKTINMVAVSVSLSYCILMVGSLLSWFYFIRRKRKKENGKS